MSTHGNPSPDLSTPEPPSDTALASPAAHSNDPITFQLSTETFITFTSTLTTGSDFFKNYFSANWAIIKLPNGAYFLDHDPTLFPDILRYLRSGQFPIYFSLDTSHNIVRYKQLLAEALYFQIPGLIKWLEQKMYLKAVKVIYIVKEVEGDAALDELMNDRFGIGEGVAQWAIETTWDTKDVYVCPRGIPGHRGEPERCGRQCRNAMASEGTVYDTIKVFKALAVGKKVTIDETLCMDGWDTTDPTEDERDLNHWWKR